MENNNKDKIYRLCVNLYGKEYVNAPIAFFYIALTLVNTVIFLGPGFFFDPLKNGLFDFILGFFLLLPLVLIINLVISWAMLGFGFYIAKIVVIILPVHDKNEIWKKRIEIGLGIIIAVVIEIIFLPDMLKGHFWL